MFWWRVVAFALLVWAPVHADQQRPVQDIVQQANRLLALGKLNDAYTLYDEAVQQDQLNYLVYFKRAATLLSLGREQLALDDFNTILEIKPDFEAAIENKAKILASRADFAAAAQLLSPHKSLKELAGRIKDAQGAHQHAQKALQKSDYDICIAQANRAIEVASRSADLKSIKATCHLQKGESQEAITSLSQLLSLQPNQVENHILLANLLFFAQADRERGLAQMKKYLHYDPEGKQGKDHFRLLKRLDQPLHELENAVAASQWQTSSRLLFGRGESEGLIRQIEQASAAVAFGSCRIQLLTQLFEWACQVLSETNKLEQASKYCDDTLRSNPDSVPARLAHARILIDQERYDEALGLLQKLNSDTGQNDRRVHDLYNKATKLKKVASQKDYYKILGVKRDASKQEIKKAYRKQTIQYHPDKYKGSLSEDQVQRKMSDINQAHEVLSNDELRQQYDNGDDPNDPESQQRAQQGSNPFGGNPFGGNPFGGFGGDPFGQAGGQHFFFQQGQSGGQRQQFKFKFG